MFLFKLIVFRVTALLCLLAGSCYAQRADTTVHKRHYSACSYYPGAYDRIQFESNEPKILFSLGNYDDTLKTGHWLYFFSSGILLAEGNYEKGIKTGTWKYYTSRKEYRRVQFSRKYPTTEKICFGPGNSPMIYDMWGDKTYPKKLINGIRPPTPHTVMLD